MLSTVVFLLAMPVAASGEEAPSTDKPSTHELQVQPAFQHWFSKDFGTPFGMRTPSLVVGVRPGVEFLEVRLHYTVSLDKLTLPTNGERSVVGFANADLLLTYELKGRWLRMVAGLGWSAGFVHTSQGLGFSCGPIQVTRVLYDLNDTISVGAFVDLRTQLYHLPGDDTPIMDFSSKGIEFGHADSQVQSGAVFTFF